MDSSSSSSLESVDGNIFISMPRIFVLIVSISSERYIIGVGLIRLDLATPSWNIGILVLTQVCQILSGDSCHIILCARYSLRTNCL